MLWITCILIGMLLGQHVRLSVSPELSAFLKASWALASEKAPAIKASTAAAANHIKSTASKTLKATAKPALSAGEVA
jgi:hypothetical protein